MWLKLFKSLLFGIPSNRHRAANYTVGYTPVFTTWKSRYEAYIYCRESRRPVVIKTHISETSVQNLFKHLPNDSIPDCQHKGPKLGKCLTVWFCQWDYDIVLHSSTSKLWVYDTTSMGYYGFSVFATVCYEKNESLLMKAPVAGCILESSPFSIV
jgi:hypothetical protein